MCRAVAELSTNVEIRISQYIPFTQAEGPGNRACIQVQGCPIRCPGCAVPHTWSADGGKVVETQSLVSQILDGPEVEGVTFLGGEPFAQAAALADLGRQVKENGLSVVTFSGYRIEDITSANRDCYNDLLSVTDLLIDGPFERENVNFSRPWVGSSNQRYHFLTNRYLHLANTLPSIPNRIEIRLKPDGRVLINGLAPIDEMKSLIK